jgi:hypothetical protein
MQYLWTQFNFIHEQCFTQCTSKSHFIHEQSFTQCNRGLISCIVIKFHFFDKFLFDLLALDPSGVNNNTS